MKKFFQNAVEVLFLLAILIGVMAVLGFFWWLDKVRFTW